MPPRKSPVGSRGTVYLTFDDGPSPYTEPILRVLKQTKSTATFFQLGTRRPLYPRATAAILAQGSNIGNHTYDHTDLTTLSAKGVRHELAGGPRSHCARPPYGATNTTVRRVLKQQGYRQMLWTVDSLDWTRPGTSWIVYRGAPADIHDGSIILMHDGGGPREQSVAALPRIISNLHDRGYRLRRLPGC